MHQLLAALESAAAPPWPLAFAGAAAGALGSIAAVLALAV